MTFHFPDQVATNDLTIEATDPKSGTSEFKATAIRVEKLPVEDADRAAAPALATNGDRVGATNGDRVPAAGGALATPWSTSGNFPALVSANPSAAVSPAWSASFRSSTAPACPTRPWPSRLPSARDPTAYDP